MEIKGFSNNQYFVNQTKNKAAENVRQQDAKEKDKIEISAEARNLAKTDFSSKRAEEIRQKISSGFYESEEVLNKVADKILRDIQK
ncbi:MAG: flagellar biosynthesis anti-sigma factor FlgM [Bacteroidota bacterium]